VGPESCLRPQRRPRQAVLIEVFQEPRQDSKPPGAHLHRFLAQCACTAALFFTIRAVLAQQPLRWSEPVLLRWLRTAADHPWRSVAALILLQLAARPPAKARVGSAGSDDSGDSSDTGNIGDENHPQVEH
jgi:hypothetical protein